MTKSCERASKNENDKNDFDKNDHDTNKQAHPLWSEPDLYLIFLSRFTRVACHLSCQVALGEAEGATLGNGCKHLGELGKSGECEEKSYGGKDTAVDYS